jgi:hypothetical protein
MFLQIKLDERDQNSHRYLWRGLDVAVPPKIYKMQRLTFGVNSSPFLAIIQHHAKTHQSTFPEAAAEVQNNMFVDDTVTGTDDVARGKQLINQLRGLMSIVSFELTKWASNSTEIIESISQEQRNPTLSIGDSSRCLKSLGVSWNTNTDELSIDVKNALDSNDPGTRRSTASIIAKIHDPLDIAGPFTVTAKLLLQQICHNENSWDTELDAEDKQQWLRWKSQLPMLQKLSIPRLLPIPDHGGRLEIHGFGDASPRAYGAAVFVRAEYSVDRFRSGLVISKNHIAPTKSPTLPRLELLAAGLTAKLTKFTSENFHKNINDVHLWTDSLVTYHWIRSKPDTLKSFVSNRVKVFNKYH